MVKAYEEKAAEEEVPKMNWAIAFFTYLSYSLVILVRNDRNSKYELAMLQRIPNNRSDIFETFVLK